MSTNAQVSQVPQQPLAPGVRAPEFSLHSTPDQTVSLSEARGRPVVLIFYPADWSPVCGSELALFNELLPEFHKYNAALACISVDGAWCHIAYAREGKLKFPLLSDFEPKGAVARAYGVYREHDGTARDAADEEVENDPPGPVRRRGEKGIRHAGPSSASGSSPRPGVPPGPPPRSTGWRS